MPNRSTSNGWLIIALCAALFGLGQFHRASGSVYTPILMDRFDASATVISGLVSAMFTAAVLAQIPLGSVLDRYGPRAMLAGSIFVVAIGTTIFALGEDYNTLLVSRLVIGLGVAALGASSHVIVARSFPEREFGYVNGMIITLGSMGGMIGTYPLALALSSFGWAWVFGVAALAALVLLAVVWRTVEPGPIRQNTEQGVKPAGYLALLRVAEMRKILALSLVTFAPITTITGIWGGPFLQDTLGFSADGSGAVLLLLFVGSISSAFLIGQLDRRINQRKLMILTSAGLSACSLLLLALLPNPGVIPSIALLFAMIFFQQYYIPLGAHMRRVAPVESIGRASILVSLVGVAMIPIMQTGFGAILDLAAAQGFDTAQQYRFAFGAMGLLIIGCAAVYATAQEANAE